MGFDLIVNIILVTIGFSLVGAFFYNLWFEDNNEEEEEGSNENTSNRDRRPSDRPGPMPLYRDPHYDKPSIPSKRVGVGVAVTKEGMELTIAANDTDRKLHLSDFKVAELIDNIDKFYLDEEALKETTIEAIHCGKQPLSYIYLPEGIKTVICHNSGIEYIDLPESTAKATISAKTTVNNLFELFEKGDPDIVVVNPNDVNNNTPPRPESRSGKLSAIMDAIRSTSPHDESR